MGHKEKQREVIRKIALAGVLTAVGVLGGTLSVPVGFSKCCPMQSVINIIGGMFLGPWYATAMAFCVALLRNLLGTGSIMAFPGSMCGALLAGLLYRCLPKLWMSCLGEIIGTGIISALLAWPIAIFILGTPSAPFAYVVPFMTAALVGVVIASVLMFLMNRSGALNAMRRLARGD